MASDLYPRGGSHQSILASPSFRGVGIVVGCDLVFCVAFGFSAFAVVSFALVFISRSVLVAPFDVVAFRLFLGSAPRVGRPKPKVRS